MEVPEAEDSDFSEDEQEGNAEKEPCDNPLATQPPSSSPCQSQSSTCT